MSREFTAANGEIIHGSPLLTPRAHVSTTSGAQEMLTPRSPRHDGTGDPISNCHDILLILKVHQAEVMTQLHEWMSKHEKNLVQTISRFQECVPSANGISRQTSPFSKDLESPRRCISDNDSPRKCISKGKLRRSASRESEGTEIPDFVSRKVSEKLSDAFSSRPSLRTQKRRPSVGSVTSYESEESPYFISVEDLRDQCQMHSGSFLKSSQTFTESPAGCMRYRVNWLVNTFFFELFFAGLICINSVLLGVEVAVVSSSPSQDVPHVFYYLTIIFTVAFLMELTLRLVSEGGIISFLVYSELRAWNWFDLFVVTCSLVEVGFNFVLLGGGSQSITRIMRMARMTRLGRVLRIARIVRFVSQLRVLVISIVSTLQTLLWALFLLLIIIYVFAVLLAQATAEHFSESASFDRDNLAGFNSNLDHYWGSLQAAMYTLFMSIAGGVSWEVAVSAIGQVHWIWGAFFTCFVAFSSFALINVMTAVFCQSAIESAQRNVEVRWQALNSDKRKHIETLKRLFKSLDGNTKGTINLRKLVRCWGDEAMQAFLNTMDLAPDDCWTFFAILDKQEQEVTAADFVEGCLRLRGFAKAFDVAVLTFELRHLSRQNITFMNRMQDSMNAILTAVTGSAASNADDTTCSE